jgi:nitric oxide reductase subunit B
MLPLFGVVFMAGALTVVYDLITLGQRVQTPARFVASASSERLTGWRKPLTGFEAGIWLLGMWVFGSIITLGLLSFNLPRVRVEGDPTLPYLLAGVGYPGLLLVTMLFVWRFLASMEARMAVADDPVTADNAMVPNLV